ncbi:MCE family protein [Halomonas campisalis]|uniref:MCE family protein n=1 Tax=Billgrantia campisalis TaxID=74661 RepID=A0ABS9P7I5_9GAMM|nr:MlaD family protein [Halomonas campisalis]MCG6657187.1 MCE family protein [Halomonas campisalis]MDR5862372.1 MlaD family protein [Halomonas campisalis]
METRAHHVIIGLFTVLAAAGGVLFAVWLGQGTADRDFAHFEVFFDRSVSGLSVGNAVEYSGVRVGDVTDLRLDPTDPRNVLARIRVRSDVPVKQDTRARLALANITGSMSIQLHGGTPESPPLLAVGERPPRIVADPSPIGALLEDSEELMASVNSVLAGLEALLSEENTAKVTRIIANLERTSDQLAALGGGSSQLMEQLEALIEEAIGAIGELGAVTRQTGTLLDNQGERIVLGARETTESLARTARGLESLLADHQGALESGLQGIQGLGPASAELRRTLGTLNRIVRRLEESPADFLMGRDGIEEFSP